MACLVDNHPISHECPRVITKITTLWDRISSLQHWGLFSILIKLILKGLVCIMQLLSYIVCIKDIAWMYCNSVLLLAIISDWLPQCVTWDTVCNLALVLYLYSLMGSFMKYIPVVIILAQLRFLAYVMIDLCWQTMRNLNLRLFEFIDTALADSIHFDPSPGTYMLYSRSLI